MKRNKKTKRIETEIGKAGRLRRKTGTRRSEAPRSVVV